MLKQVKEKTGLKGNDLAAFLGVTPATLFNWEKGNQYGTTWPLWAILKCGFRIESKGL